MRKIHLINFADENYHEIQRESSRRALDIGLIDSVHEMSPKDIEDDFIQTHKEIFKHSRGFGLWLWKPYFINKLISSLPYDDILIYADAGVSFIRDVKPVIDVLDSANHDMVFFDLPLRDTEWTKAETYKEIGYKPTIYDRQIDGSFFLLRVSDKTRKIVRQWLDMCCNEKIISPDVFDGMIKDYPNFQAHREDQSVLSIIVHKNGIETYRDPSDYGEFPFQYKGKHWTYLPQKYDNSPYPTITVHNRSIPIESYIRTYRLKHLLAKLGLWNEFVFDLKNR